MTTAPSRHYHLPARLRNQAGEVRKMGLELELANLSLEDALSIVAQNVGGTIVMESRAQGTVEGTLFGTFKVEFDSASLKQRRYLEPLERLGVDAVSNAAQRIEETVLGVAKELVPIEIVTPPVPWDRLAELDPLWAALRSAGAADTRSSVLYAFGLHLNPETPDYEAGTLLAYLRSFLLLEDWIVEDSEPDLTRKLTPYIRGFPEAYRRKVLDPRYAPDLRALIQDYALHNPTRNRPLDLLPLFSFALEARGEDVDELAQKIDDWQLVGRRPTFHYRLPNSEIAQPGWSPVYDCNRWVTIERVADDPVLLRALSEAYLTTTDLPLRLQKGSWASEVRARLFEAIPTVFAQALG